MKQLVDYKELITPTTTSRAILVGSMNFVEHAAVGSRGHRDRRRFANSDNRSGRHLWQAALVEVPN